jgi:hypothetical protein
MHEIGVLRALAFGAARVLAPVLLSHRMMPALAGGRGRLCAEPCASIDAQLASFGPPRPAGRDTREGAMRTNHFRRLHDDWAVLTHYQRFESLVALVLSLVSSSSRCTG